MEAEQVRRIMACAPTEVDEVAALLNVPVPQAKGVRLQFLRLLTGKCSLCGRLAEYGMCHWCKKSARSKPFLGTKPFRILKKMDPNDILTRRRCIRCDKEFTVTVREVLRAFMNGTGSKLPELCPAFRAHPKRKTCRPLPRKPKQPKQPKKPEAFNHALAKPLAALLEAGKLKPAPKKNRKRKQNRKRPAKVKKPGVIGG